MISYFCIFWDALMGIFCSLLKHDLFEWIGLIGTLAGVWFALVEIRKSRKATELSNRQCLFEKRLKNYFIHKEVLHEVNNDWQTLESILHNDSKKDMRADNINIAFQIFFNGSILSKNQLNNDAIEIATDLYNRKAQPLCTISEETNILFYKTEFHKDATEFFTGYTDMLYRLFIARIMFGGNATTEEDRRKAYGNLRNAINILSKLRLKEEDLLPKMQRETNINEE